MTFSVSGVFSWMLANRGAILVSVGLIIASASALIKALEMLTAILVTAFPKLKGVDGEFKSIAGWLDAAAKSNFLNSVALSPKKAAAVVKVVIVLLALCVVGLAAPASAQVLVSSGPTLPLMEVRPANPHPVSLAAGAGYQLSLTSPLFQRAVGGRAWDFLDFDLMAFGTAVSSTSGSTFGAFSGAVGICTLSSLLCLGVGHDIATTPGLKPGWFGLFALSINFATQPSSPPVGTEKGTLGLQRGNHLYFGGT